MKRLFVVLLAASIGIAAYFYFNQPPAPKKPVTVSREDADKKMLQVLEKSKRDSTLIKSIGAETTSPEKVSKNNNSPDPTSK